MRNNLSRDGTLNLQIIVILTKTENLHSPSTKNCPPAKNLPFSKLAILPPLKTCHFDRSEAKWRNLLFPPPQKLVILSEAEGPAFRRQRHKDPLSDEVGRTDRRGADVRGSAKCRTPIQPIACSNPLHLF
jgi:hypothetical protein